MLDKPDLTVFILTMGGSVKSIHVMFECTFGSGIYTSVLVMLVWPVKFSVQILNMCTSQYKQELTIHVSSGGRQLIILITSASL